MAGLASHIIITWTVVGYDEENWCVPDIDLFHEQLQEIDENTLAYNADKEVLNLIRSMFSKAKNSHGDITISSY